MEALSLEALSLEALSRCLEPLSKCRGGGGQELEGEGVRQGRSSFLLLGRKPGLSPWIGLGQAMGLGTATLLEVDIGSLGGKDGRSETSDVERFGCLEISDGGR